MEYKGLMSKEMKQSINELVVISVSTLDITLVPFAKPLPPK